MTSSYTWTGGLTEWDDWKPMWKPINPPPPAPKVSSQGLIDADPNRRLLVDTHVTAGRNVAIATAKVKVVGGELVIGVGESKRQPGDEHDPVIGASLAAARALMNLGRELERRAMAAVEENE